MTNETNAVVAFEAFKPAHKAAAKDLLSEVLGIDPKTVSLESLNVRKSIYPEGRQESAEYTLADGRKLTLSFVTPKTDSIG